MRLMRCHLSEAVGRLGVDLPERFVEADSVFLLPSAFATDLRNGRERKWATEIFAQETLELRQSIFLLPEAMRQPLARAANSAGAWKGTSNTPE